MSIIDLETTGLRPLQDRILEFGAVRVRGGEITDIFTRLVRQADGVPAAITALTGIDEAMAARDGVPLHDALPEFLALSVRSALWGIIWRLTWRSCGKPAKACGLHPPTNRCTDLLGLARRKVFDVPNYKLETLAGHFLLDIPAPHRALHDCRILFALQKKLNEN